MLVVLNAPNSYRIDQRSIEKQKTAGPASFPAGMPAHTGLETGTTALHAADQVERQLCQLNDFLQTERKRLPDTEWVLHAKRTKAGWMEREGITLYIRPKAEGFFNVLFDRIINGGEQRRAAKVISTLAGAYAAGSPHRKASCPAFLAPDLAKLKAPGACVDSASARSLKKLARTIAEEKRGRPGAPAIERQSSMRGKVRSDLNSNRAHGTVLVGEQQAIKDLQPFGFKPAEIEAFGKLVLDIVNDENKGNEDLYSLRKFQKEWIRQCDLDTDDGKKFREFICKNPCYRAWNLVTLHLADRTAPKFDLRSYRNFGHIMVPPTNALVWSEEVNDGGKMHEMIGTLHENSRLKGKTQSLSFKESNFSYYRQMIYAATSCVISSEQTELEPAQRNHLDEAYRSVFPDSRDGSELILLTPLFNYTEKTIDACVAAMLRTLRVDLENGNPLSKVDIFSNDPRIKAKFYEARRTLQVLDEVMKKKTIDVRGQPAPGVTSTALRAEEVSKPDDMAASIALNTLNDVTTCAEEFVDDVATYVTDVGNRVAKSVREVGDDVVTDVREVWNGIATYSEQDRESKLQPFSLFPPARPSALEGRQISADVASSDYPAACVSLASGDAGISATSRRKTQKRTSEIKGATGEHRIRRHRARKEAKIAPPALTAPPVAREIKLQIGITEGSWCADENTVLMLSSSAAACLQPDQMEIRTDLESILKSDIFSECEEARLIYKPHDLRKGKHQLRFFFPIKELPIAAPVLSSHFGSPDTITSSGITKIYKEVCEKAAVFDIYKLVLPPCFRQPAMTLLASDKPYEEAIAAMLETLDQLRVASPRLDITLVARSEAENSLIQKALTALEERKRTTYQNVSVLTRLVQAA